MITGDIWKKVNDRVISKYGIRKAAIAYVTKKSTILKKGDFLLCDASKHSIKFGKSRCDALNYYYNKGVEIYTLENLHSKFLFTDKTLVIGSANLSKNSAKILTESAIISNKRSEISSAKAFFYQLTKESKKIDKKYLDEISKIKVILKENPQSKISKSRKINFGKSIWVVGVTPLSDRIYEKEVEHVNKNKSKISKIHNIDENDISFIRFTGNRKIRKESKIGDSIIQISNNNKKKTRSIIYESSPILQVEQQKNCTRIYFDSRGLKEMSFSKFNIELSKTPVKPFSKTSLRRITKDHLFYVNQIMK